MKTFVILMRRNTGKTYGRVYTHSDDGTVEQFLASTTWGSDYEVVASFNTATEPMVAKINDGDSSQMDDFARAWVDRNAPAKPIAATVAALDPSVTRDANHRPTKLPERTPFDPWGEGWIVESEQAHMRDRNVGSPFASPDTKPTDHLVNPSFAMAAQRSA